ncbi:MAG: plasmid pRiA4b ORF-3 family protein [Deltaproteobacteria bacterium]|nr:plasmid pRiA4b ORF-3 family protein [Kofleriaceae bacterium]
MGDTAFAIDVRIREIEPPIWRSIELSGTSTLEDLHYAIQAAMGWTNSHLHQFVIGSKQYGAPEMDDAGLLDERRFRVQDVLGPRASCVYEYDFGDGWEHDVSVTSVTPADRRVQPRCTAGERACPPEDCGGPGGYAVMLAALADPSHEEHGMYAGWAGDFRPERFDLPKKGRGLREDMADLKALAADDSPIPDDDDDERADPLADVPPALIELALGLPPMKRAALAALLTGSLATDLMETLEAANKLLATRTKRERPKSGRSHRRPRKHR